MATKAGPDPDRERKRPGRKPKDIPCEGDHFGAKLGRRIRELRLAKGLSVAESSGRTDGLVSDSSWHSYERGQEPSASRFLAVCEALGSDPRKIAHDLG